MNGLADRREMAQRQSGVYGCETWLEVYLAYAHEHAEQIRRAREDAARH